jgi:hypothetical protein
MGYSPLIASLPKSCKLPQRRKSKPYQNSSQLNPIPHLTSYCLLYLSSNTHFDNKHRTLPSNYAVKIQLHTSGKRKSKPCLSLTLSDPWHHNVYRAHVIQSHIFRLDINSNESEGMLSRVTRRIASETLPSARLRAFSGLAKVAMVAARADRSSACLCKYLWIGVECVGVKGAEQKEQGKNGRAARRLLSSNARQKGTGEGDELPFLPSPLTLIPVRPTARGMAKQGKAHVC